MTNKRCLEKQDVRNFPRKGQRKTCNQKVTCQDFSAYANSRRYLETYHAANEHPLERVTP